LIFFFRKKMEKTTDIACREFGLELDSKEPIGHGRFGLVFRAKTVATGSKPAEFRALKISLTKNDERIAEYLKGEVSFQQSLQHKNIIRVYNSMIDPEFVAIEMELCSKTLSKYMRHLSFDSSKHARESFMRPIARDIFRGLLAIHNLGVFHRDIKPDNILVFEEPDGSVTAKISDFGLAKSVDESRHTKVGSISHMAPEILENVDIPYDTSCDIWSAGITLYQMLTGKLPVLDRRCEVYHLPDGGNFTDCCKHFISGVLVRDPSKRLTCKEALHHPFLMPKICGMQLIQPDQSLHVVTGKIESIESGDVAFKNAVNSLSLSTIMQTHSSEVAWKVTWADIMDAFGWSSFGDVLILTNSGEVGKVFQKSDAFVFSEDDDVNVLVVAKKRDVPLPKIRVEDFAEANKSVSVEEKKLLEQKKSDKDRFNFYFRQITARYSLCSGILKHFLGHVRSVFSMEPLLKDLSKAQASVIKKAPGFPTLAFIEPERPALTPPDALEAALDDLGKMSATATGAKKKAQDKMKSLSCKFTAEIDILKGIMSTWVSEKPCGCEQVAIDFFNNTIDTLQTGANLMARLSEYICFLQTIMAADELPPQSVVLDKLSQIIDGCPYLNLSVGKKSIEGPCAAPAAGPSSVLSPGNTEGDLALLLQTQIDEQQKTYSLLQKHIEELRQRNEQLNKDSLKLLSEPRAIVEQLKKVLTEHGIPIPSTEIDEEKLKV